MVTECTHWIVDGKLHRLDGPARIWDDGQQEWWANDKRHRLDGPAVIRADGRQEWWANGQLHRLDGPAIIRANGEQEWSVNNKELDPVEVKNWFSECSINPNWKEWTDDEKILFRMRF